jgi:putative transposase
MRPKNHTLDRRQVHRAAVQHLQAHLRFRDYKRKASAPVLWSLLLAAAARITSLSDACGRLRDAPSDETARKALLATLPDYAELQRRLNAALAGHLPRPLRKRPQRLAIDLTLIPYHGRPYRDPAEVYRAQAKDGTSHFHAYATAYVVLKGQRYTVALTGVAKGEPLKDVVRRLLRQAASVGVRPRLLLLDRGFYSVAVVRYLQQAGVPFLLPVVCHGRSPKQPGGPTGSHVFRTWKISGWSTHTLTEAKTGRTATVPICVKCRNYRGQWKRHGRQALVYAYWGYRPASPDSVFATYRLRFGIESSYRQMHEGRIRTTTRRPEVRLLYAGIALVLRNLWVWLHYAVLAMPRRGGRVILLERLRWETLLLWLLHVAEATFGVADTTVTERVIPYELAG